MTYLSVPLEILDNAGASRTLEGFLFIGVDVFPLQRPLSKENQKQESLANITIQTNSVGQ